MISYNNKKPNGTMTALRLKIILQTIAAKTRDDYEIWFPSDEERNRFSSMSRNINVSVCIDKDSKAAILFPSH